MFIFVKKNKNFQGTSTYNYRMKDLKERNERIILELTAQEILQFSPFREETEDSFITESRSYNSVIIAPKL